MAARQQEKVAEIEASVEAKAVALTATHATTVGSPHPGFSRRRLATERMRRAYKATAEWGPRGEGRDDQG
jgi:hypothetical protein